MTDNTSTTPDETIRFPSLESLRAAHSQLLKRFRISGAIPEMIIEVEAFIRRGRATGALLDDDADRWAAQSQLDYWATQLYQPGYEPPDAALDEFDPQLAPEIDDALCPFMGLDAFREANQSVFFGRERLLGDLIEKLKTARFLAVLGSSGSGKSSLVRAGLIPALKKIALPESDKWIYFSPMVPGADPLANLARLILPANAEASLIEAAIDHLRQEPEALPRLAAKQFTESIVLVVDQFEEVFTLCTDEVARNRFVDNLIRLSQMQDSLHRVIITMRSDFESNVARLPNLQAVLEQNEFRLTALSANELRQAIEAPAALIGLRFEQGVVDALLNDILGEPAALPLLQFTLLKLWDNRERNRVTWESYKKLGGGRQALARSVDDFYNRLIPEEQVTMQRILLKMVRPGEGLEITSNRVRRFDLYQKAEANDRIDRVLDKLIQARLVRVSEGDIDKDDQVEIAHEALIRNWPHLVEWLEEERVALRQRQRLTTAAEEWQRLNQESSALWRGVLLNESRRYDDLSHLEMEFIEASFEAEQTETNRKLEEARRQKELEYTQKLAETEKLRADEQTSSAVKLRQSAVYLVVLLVIAVILSIFAGSASISAQNAQHADQTSVVMARANAAMAEANAKEAATQQAIAQKNANAAELQAEIARAGELSAEAIIQQDKGFNLALLLGVEAYRKYDNFLSRWVLLDNTQTNPQILQYLARHNEIVYSVAFSPDGKLLASSSEDKTIILWDVATGQPIGQPLAKHTSAIYSVAFSPDGKTLASGSVDRTIILWDVATHQPILTLEGHTSTIFSVVFSPDGRTLASSGSDHTIILWDVMTGKQLNILTGHSSTVYSVVFSPDGKILASGSADKSVILWNVATGQSFNTLKGHTSTVRVLAFSPDGTVLASGSLDTTVIMWNMATGEQIRKLARHTSSVRSLTFSPDGKTLASGSADKTIILWNVADGERLGEPLTGHTDIVRGLAYSPDGKILASGSYDGNVILWDATGSQSLGRRLTDGHTDYVKSVAFSPDGTILASGSIDGNIIFWNVATGKLIGQPLTGHTDFVNSVAFSPDGTILASGSDDKTILLWNVAKRQPQGSLIGHNNKVLSVAFSPDGTILASGSCGKLDSDGNCTETEGEIILWNVAQRTLIQKLTGYKGIVYSVVFSPDGKTLASSSCGLVDTNGNCTGGEIILWDVATSSQIGQPLAGHRDSVRSLAFSPNGTILASGSEDNTIILWDVITGQQIGQPLTAHNGSVTSLSFSSDGLILASGSEDNTVILWDVEKRRPLGQPLIGHDDFVTSLAFSPDGKTLASGSDDYTIILWNVDLNSWIEKACQRAGRNFTREEWAQYFPEENYHRTCPEWPEESDATPTPSPTATPNITVASSPTP